MLLTRCSRKSSLLLGLLLGCSAGAMSETPMQNSLFAEADAAVPIAGLRYEPDFLSREEERGLLEVIATLPLHAAK